MSIAEFTGAIREAAFKTWFNSSKKNILVQTVKELRPEAEQREKTSFFLSTDTLIQIAEKLSGKQLTEQQTDTLISDLLGLIDNKRAILVQEELVKGNKTVTGIYFRQIIYDTGISSVLEKSLQSIKDRVTITEKDGKERPAIISDFFQRGHVFGVASNVTTQTARNLAKSQVSEESKKKLLRVLVTVRNRLIKDDLATSNIKDLKFSLYAKYFKTPYKYLVEMQVKEVNRAAGNETKVFTEALKRYFNPGNNAPAIAKMFARKDASTGDILISKLLKTPGSPSYIDLALGEVVSKMTGKKKKSQYSVSDTKVLDSTTKFDSKKLNSSIKTNIAATNKAINKVNSILIPKDNIISSVASLEAILRSRLVLQVRKNMGTGNAKNVLNYRTGRFAESATIDRLTISRQGMVTAFYNYMRHPYATFSEGGEQQYPKSRDPKLLISKSIREIGAELVGNRLRAVLV